MGTWPVENSPAGPRRHQTPLRTSRVGGGGGGERPGGGDWGPVRCAPPDGSPPLPGPVISPHGPGEERTGVSPDGSPPLPGPVISPRGPGEERTGVSP